MTDDTMTTALHSARDTAQRLAPLTPGELKAAREAAMSTAALQDLPADFWELPPPMETPEDHAAIVAAINATPRPFPRFWMYYYVGKLAANELQAS